MRREQNRARGHRDGIDPDSAETPYSDGPGNDAWRRTVDLHSQVLARERAQRRGGH